MNDPLRCNWRDGELCPFPELEPSVRSYHGKPYCQAHLPAAAKGDNSVGWVQGFIANRVYRDLFDFRGLVFVAETGKAATYILNAGAYDCRHSDIQMHVVIETSKTNKANFSESVFRGRNHLRGRWKSLDCSHCDFHGEVECQFESGTGSIDFTRSHFRSKLKLRKVGELSQLSFDDCQFERAPAVLDDKIPQQTTFSRAKFRKTSLARQDEGKYRHIRNLFHANRARESEGQFYALEKRAHRRSLPWMSGWFARGLSWLYDLSSAYGRSYERAFLLLVLVQIAFGIGYGIAANRFRVPGSIDTEVLSFTLSQVVKPFELFSARELAGSAYEKVLNVNQLSTPWVLWTFAHSIVSLSLIALFLLALRWRFRRD